MLSHLPIFTTVVLVGKLEDIFIVLTEHGVWLSMSNPVKGLIKNNTMEIFRRGHWETGGGMNIHLIKYHDWDKLPYMLPPVL